MASVFNVQESEYELDRKRKIKENNEMMKRVFGDEILMQWSSTNTPGRKNSRRSQRSEARRRTVTVQSPVRRNPKRNARSYPTAEESLSEDSDSDLTSGKRLIVHWVGPLTKKRRCSSSFGVDADGEVESDSDIVSSLRTSKRRPGSARIVIPASEITEEDLLLVADCPSEKRKDPENGTSCHQCRQKTDDLKTICRSESCVGVRGQFCGPCLRNRYGESVKDALLDPEWSCPPCRNICNCSFCMVKRGRRCTGPLIGIARQNGYQDVKSFLGD